ncbi:MAG TPA: dephospho-CoA kinase [Solirubrobacteraceae bacterium]|jgi:dephospho-CoA kinase|nr:dephospho-CoA kinase [Solirubrobacteraceae bacterium]
MQPAVPFVGLTGGMGAGKSTALQALARLGAEVLSSDAVVHELYEGDELREAVVARFGEQVAPGGVVDRAAVARRAFATAEDRAWLEGLIWPLVGARVAAWLDHARARRPPARAAVVEVPLLFEAGLERVYDATIAVIAEESLRHDRAAVRGHELADERAARQLTQAEKAERATYVVHNDGSVEALEHELSAVLDKLTG